MKKLLVANRGEIAIRIMRSAAEAGFRTVAVYPADDAQSGHVTEAGEAIILQGDGTAAYLAIDDIISAARRAGRTRSILDMAFYRKMPRLRGPVTARASYLLDRHLKRSSYLVTRSAPARMPNRAR
jgi:hypothetical protein